jgi:hypothetical protein
MSGMQSHHLPQDPDPNDVADFFEVDPSRERAGDHPEQTEEKGRSLHPGAMSHDGEADRTRSEVDEA